MMPVEIREASSKDLPSIYDLVVGLAIYEQAEEKVTATIEDYHRDFSGGLFRALVAEYEGEVIAMALFYPTYSTWKGKMLYLEDLYVKEQHRRKGIGQMLFDHLIQVGRDEDFRLMKWQVLDWNTPAIKFYERNSALIDKTWWNGMILLSAPES
jgi:GNAT superfamily N-acetyltransferase